jgi:hypothetical protein
MKKYISIFALALVLGLGFASCSTETDEPAGGTAVEKMAGHWVVTVDAYDEAGNLLYEDPYGMGEWNMYTYNTADDDADQMWLSDGNNFWGYTIKVNVDVNALTFDCKDLYIYSDNDGNDVTCTITNGRIIPNGGLNVNGKPTDAIMYNIEFSDDPGSLYFVHGVRYAGF